MFSRLANSLGARALLAALKRAFFLDARGGWLVFVAVYFMKKEFTIALCYDFDGTLSPENMQEYSFIPQLQKKPKSFWNESCKIARKQDADAILAYMYLMCDEAKKHDIKIRRADFARFGRAPMYSTPSRISTLFNL